MDLSAWFFFKTMNISGAEAVVAAASPWVGQGESACLVRPYVDIMTESELHLSMTSGECHSPPFFFLPFSEIGAQAHICLFVRFLHYLRLSARGIHRAWCARSEPRHVLGHVDPCVHCD